MRFADPKSDIAFKKIFGNENKKEILISFLNAVLDFRGKKEIVELEILNPYQAPKIAELKETNLDVRAKNKEGITFIVEMQLEHQSFFAKRVLYYTSKAYIGQIEKAVNYPKLNQVIFIGIMDFNLFEGEDYMSRHLILDTQTYKHSIKDFEFNFIELPKFTKTEEELKTTMDKWIYFLKYADDLQIIPKKLSEPKEITEAFEVVEQYNWTKDELEFYESWEMRRASEIDARETAVKKAVKEAVKKAVKVAVKKVVKKAEKQGEERGIKIGREEGRKAEKLEIAKKMLPSGLSLENIAQFTGLPKEEIEKLTNHN